MRNHVCWLPDLLFIGLLLDVWVEDIEGQEVIRVE